MEGRKEMANCRGGGRGGAASRCDSVDGSLVRVVGVMPRQLRLYQRPPLRCNNDHNYQHLMPLTTVYRPRRSICTEVEEVDYTLRWR